VDEHLTLDFMAFDEIRPVHLAFKVSEAEFDEIFSRVKRDGVAYGGSPRDMANGKTYAHNGGRGVYFRDPDGHGLEILTADYHPDREFEEV
jgi:catechol 2,3-dioxygenase-like lactoylglutathione lyase family enzyme